jgi:hypothetical protein
MDYRLACFATELCLFVKGNGSSETCSVGAHERVSSCFFIRLAAFKVWYELINFISGPLIIVLGLSCTCSGAKSFNKLILENLLFYADF